MRVHIRANRLVYILLGAVLAVGLATTAFVVPERTLTASTDCYGLCPSATTLSLSRARVVYGHEWAEKFSVKVSSGAPGNGVPTGHVVVKSGTKVLCRILLSDGAGYCRPADRALRPGRHKVVAHYKGNSTFEPSTSTAKTLIVLRHASVTTLSLSRARVRYGREWVEKFRVRVFSQPRWIGVPTGRVVVTSWRKVLCRIRLHDGTGYCRPGAWALAVGRHKIVAHYKGNALFKPSKSAREILIVLRY